MSNVKKIIVILPTYNNEKTIERSIKSVLNQTYTKNVYLLIVPNGCTDSTIDISKKVIAEHEANLGINSICVDLLVQANQLKGVVPAFNFALDFALERGIASNVSKENIWVCRMDGDDAWRPNKLEKQVEFLELNTNVDVLGAQMNLVKPDNFEPLGSITNNPLEDEIIKENIFKGSNPIANPVAIYRWSIMNNIGRFENIFPYAEDYWFYCKAALAEYKFANLSNVLMDYTFEVKIHSHPAIGQNVGIISNNVLQYNNIVKQIKQSFNE